MLFAFLTYRDPQQSRVIKVFQSLIFQLLIQHKDLLPVLHDAFISRYEDLTGSSAALQTMFLDLVKGLGKVFVLVDGLDEAEVPERSNLLKSLLNIRRQSTDVKLLISCRAERVLSKELGTVSRTLRVDQHNARDLTGYVTTKKGELIDQLRELDGDEEIFNEVETAAKTILSRANGRWYLIGAA